MTPPAEVEAYFRDRGFTWLTCGEQFGRLGGGLAKYVSPVKERTPPFAILCWTAVAIRTGADFAISIPVKEEDNVPDAISAYVTAELREWKG